MSERLTFNSNRSEPLATPATLKKEFATTIAQRKFVEQSRDTIVRILNGQDPRLLLIMGPCSIHDLDSASHYAQKIQKLSDKISDVFFPIMRVYFEKPRTSVGWKGMMYDPHLDGSHDMNSGLRFTRHFLLSLADLKIPAAAEILDPLSAPYLGDLLSWGCIGARTASSQIHRQAASGFPFPTAFKNNPDGNVEVAIQGVISASKSHAYIGINEEGQVVLMHSSGNPHCHVVLRGSERAPNYDAQSVRKALALLEKESLPSTLIIDCSHDNSCRNHTKQSEVFENVIGQVVAGAQSIRGIILEGHINAGNQTISKDLKYGVSLTDACMDWDTTEQLILAARTALDLKSRNHRDKVRETQVAVLA